MSSSQSQAARFYTDAKCLYGERKYEQAAETLNRALTCADWRRRDDKSLVWRIQDLRAASLARTNDDEKLRAAYEIAKSNCEKNGKDASVAWKVQYRRADVLLCLRQPNTAAKVLDIARSQLSSIAEVHRSAAERILETLSSRISQAQAEARQRHLARHASAEDRAAMVDQHRLEALKAQKNYIQMLPRDVLLLIAQMGLKENPNFAVKMGVVCKEWRDLVCNSPNLWSELRLGKKHAASKAKLWAARARIGPRMNSDSETKDSSVTSALRSIHITEAVDDTQISPAVIAIAEVASSIRSLTVQRHLASWAADLPHSVLQAFASLQHLSLSQPSGSEGGNHGLVADLLPPGYTGLRRLELAGLKFHFRFHDAKDGSRKVDWTSDAKAHLSGVQFLSVVDCSLAAGVRETPNDHLLTFTPNVEFVNIRNGDLCLYGTESVLPRAQPPTIELLRLKSYTEVRASGTMIRFRQLSAPNLEHLCFNQYQPGLPGLSVLDQLQAPGLANARNTLRSLDIGGSSVDVHDLLRLLRDLPALQFLNVSRCGIDTAFVQALCRPESADGPGLLPNLTALSIACHPDISPAAIRDLVQSRLPPLVKMAEEARVKSRLQKMQKTPKRSLLFGPTPVDKKPKLGSTESGKIPAPASPARPVTQSEHSSSTPMPASSLRPKLPSITWLNVDHCAVLEDGLKAWLTKHVRFVSNSFGALDDDRMRGLKHYAWDGDWSEDCGSGNENKCQLRRDKRNPGSWFVHHVCERRAAEAVAAPSSGSWVDGQDATKAREIAGW